MWYYCALLLFAMGARSRVLSMIRPWPGGVILDYDIKKIPNFQKKLIFKFLNFFPPFDFTIFLPSKFTD
jgi:hypothetical protein